MSLDPADVLGYITRDHRDLDDLLGRLLTALDSGDLTRAKEAMTVFDAGLRRHTSLEDEHLFMRTAGAKLLEGPQEGEDERVRRELSLEHVQVRELSGMILRFLAEKDDPIAARAMLPNLLRRWDAHTSREEAALHSLRWPNEELGEFFLPGWLGM